MLMWCGGDGLPDVSWEIARSALRSTSSCMTRSALRGANGHVPASDTHRLARLAFFWASSYSSAPRLAVMVWESLAWEAPWRIAVREMAGATGTACFGRDPLWFAQHFVPTSKLTDSWASIASHDDLSVLGRIRHTGL